MKTLAVTFALVVAFWCWFWWFSTCLPDLKRKRTLQISAGCCGQHDYGFHVTYSKPLVGLGSVLWVRTIMSSHGAEAQKLGCWLTVECRVPLLR